MFLEIDLLSLTRVHILGSNTMCLVGMPEETPYRFWCCSNLRLRGDLVPAIWAAIRLLEPFLDAVVTKNVFALGQAQRGFIDTLRIRDTKFVVANHTCYLQLVSMAHSS